MKTRTGFYYIEMLVALSLFAILMLAALPLLNQAGQNLAYAQDGHAAQLAAQSIMLAVRDAPLGVTPAQAASHEAARAGAQTYSVWIVFDDEQLNISFRSPCAPDTTPTVTGLDGVIVVAVWNEHLHIAGRAVGVVI